MEKPILAVDIGATKMIAALFSPRGEMGGAERVSTPSRGIEEALDALVRRVLGRAGLSRVSVAGVAAPGPIDYSTGAIVGSPNLGEKKVEVARVLSRYSDRVVIENDAVAGVWAEKVLVDPRLENAVLVSIGTGIGGGVIVDGRLLHGARGNAHEIGHIVLDASLNAVCGCGGVGHWEAIAGGRWIPRTARLLARRMKEETIFYQLATSGSITAADAYEYARRGDAYAIRVVDYINRIHAAGIASITATYDPDIVFLSGGLYEGNKDLILEGVKRYLPRFLGLHSRPVVKDSTFGGLQSLYGAYAIARRPPKV